VAPELASTRAVRPGTVVEADDAAARLMNLRQAGRYLGLSYWSTRDLVAAGTIPSVRVPCPRARDGQVMRRILIDRQDLNRLIEAWKERGD
jgi:hypothetical protein